MLWSVGSTAWSRTEPAPGCDSGDAAQLMGQKPAQGLGTCDRVDTPTRGLGARAFAHAPQQGAVTCLRGGLMPATRCRARF